MNTKDLTRLLYNRYNSDAYAFLTQVRNQTGYEIFSPLRTADAIAMSLWPSRGLYLHGFEIKASRGDWLNELKKPEKADAIGKHCHYWWVVAPDVKTVIPAELPDSWGLLIVRGDQLVAAKQPKLMKALPLTWNFLAGILRKAKESNVPIDLLDEQVEARANAKLQDEEWAAKHRVQKCEDLEKKIEVFEGRSGIKIDSWDLGDVADAVRVIRDGKSENYARKLYRIRETANEIINNLDELEAK